MLLWQRAACIFLFFFIFIVQFQAKKCEGPISIPAVLVVQRPGDGKIDPEEDQTYELVDHLNDTANGKAKHWNQAKCFYGKIIQPH